MENQSLSASVCVLGFIPRNSHLKSQLSLLTFNVELFFLVDDIIGSFCEILEDFCGRAEITGDERGEAEWLSLPLADIRTLVNEIMSIRAKKLLHMVDVNILVRLLRVLDHHIHHAEGLSLDEMDPVSLPFLFPF